jgi:hypothetical protein
MVSFYFKEVKKDEEDYNNDEKNEHYAIEFLHKSLMEYMVASYIYDYLDEKFLDKSSKTNEYYINNGKDSLEILWFLFHQKIISDEIANNLIEIIKEKNQDTKDEMAKRFDKFLPYLIEKNFLYESNIENNEPIQKAKNTFYGFWQVMCNLDDKNHMPEDKDLKQKLFGEFISNYINSFNLSNMDLSKIFVHNVTLHNFNLNSSLKINFKGTFLSNLNILTAYDKYFTNINEAHSISNLKINSIFFRAVTFSNKHIFSSIFRNCEFENVIFDCEFIHNNIFIDCTFENCKNIDFKKLNKSDTIFINCTSNSKRI